MAVAYVGVTGYGSLKAAGTTIGLNESVNTAEIPAGTLLIARVLFDNAGVASKPVVSGITTPAGETAVWVSLGAARSTSTSAGAFASGELWAIKTSVPWTPSATLPTATLDTSVTMKALIVQRFTGAETTLRSTAGTAYSTTTTAASAVTTGTTPVIGDLAIGFLFGSNVAAPQAGDTDTLGGSWSGASGQGSTGGSSATNNYGIAQYKILTAASHQTYNSSAAMTAGNGAVVAVLRATIDPLVTQAAYRFYADGTETSATALAGQDTAPTVDTSSGDVNLGLRVRLQETAGGVVPASTDWALQWEKNASGTWTNAVSTAIADTYSDPGGAQTGAYLANPQSMTGQSFTGNGQKLLRAGFKLECGGAPDGQITARLYAHSGVFGSSGIPLGSVLATSTNSVASTSVPASPGAWCYFDFDGTYTLTNGTKYFIVVSSTTTIAAGPNSVIVRAQLAGSAHSGNRASWSGSVWGAGAEDHYFEVATDGVSTVLPYDSPSLTGAAATTNRLTGGTGTFVAGEVSEDGQANDLGWSASNHTELLYSITLKQADLTNGDTLRFRVLKNGATTDLTYTAYPSVTIGAGGPTTRQATVALVAASTLTATAVPERAAAVTLTAASTLTATGVPARVATVALTATSTLSATGTVAAPAPEIAATAALTAASTLTATGVRIPQAAASLVAASTLTATATRFGVPLATVALTGASTLSATAVREPQAVVSLTATSTLTATGTTVGQVAATVGLTAASTLTATGVREPQATAGLVAGSTLTATATRFGVLLATVPLTATSTLTATGVREPQATASLVATSTLTAAGIRTQPATAALVGASELTTGAVVARVPVVALTAVSTLTATGVREPQATVPLVAASTLTVTAVRFGVPLATVDLTATSTLTATCVREPQAAVSLTATSTLTVTGFQVLSATAPLTAISTLTVLADAGPRPASYLDAVLTDGPTVLWLCNEAPGATTAVDSSGSGLTGGAGAAVTFGAVGSGLISGYPTAATFAGAGNATNLLQAALTPLADGAAYSVEIWVKTTATLARWTAGDMGTTTATSRGTVLTPTAANTGAMRVYNTGNTTFEAASTAAVNDGAIHHVVGTFGSGNVRVYVDGVLAGGPTAATGTVRALQSLRVGGSSGGTNPFLGVAAGAAFYPSALSAGRVAAHYEAGTAVPVVPVLATAALVATSSLSAAATTTAAKFATAALVASSTLAATAVRVPQAAVSLTATSTLTATAVRQPQATAALTATSTLTAVTTTTAAKFATAALTAASTLTVTAVRQPQASVSLVASSTLTATAVRVRPATVALSAVSTLTATGVRTPAKVGAVTLTATAVLTVTGYRVRVVAVGLSATSTLTATAARGTPATAPLQATATLTVQLVRIPQAFVGMAATSVLVVTATITARGDNIPNAAHTGFLHALDTNLSWYPVTVPSG